METPKAVTVLQSAPEPMTRPEELIRRHWAVAVELTRVRLVKAALVEVTVVPVALVKKRLVVVTVVWKALVEEMLVAVRVELVRAELVAVMKPGRYKEVETLVGVVKAVLVPVIKPGR